MRRERLDAVIAGGGVAGAATALALARGGFEVAVVEPREPPTWLDADDPDLRMFALAPSSARLLDQLGVWSAIVAARACGYRAMEVVDAANGATIRFDAAARGRAELGWIVENRLLQHVLWQALADAGVQRVASHAVGVAASDPAVAVELGDGSRLAARIAIAAEGGGSPLRKAVGIDCATRDYVQRGVVANVRFERHHGAVAWQRFLASGPLALLPLADGRVSIVWTLPTAEAEQVLQLNDDAFADALGVASDFHYGRVLESTPRAAFPLRLQLARRFRSGRLVLVGDAAHVVHPLAGQGINLGLRDVAELRDVLVAARDRGRDIGAPDVLDRYARRRRSADSLDARAFDALQRLYAVDASPLVAARGFGLRLADRVGFVKRALAAHAAGD